MSWNRFDKFEWADDKYLPAMGEGETMAKQTVTALAKLVYKWFNDGDVYDNTHTLSGWCNNLSSYANWLHTNIPAARPILARIEDCYTHEHYEQLLFDLCENIETEENLALLNQSEKVGSIYKCEGPYKFVEDYDEGY